MNDSRASSPDTSQQPPDYSNLQFRYQIRMEIGVDEKAERVNVGGLFRAMMRRVHQQDSTTVFLDIDECKVPMDDSLATANFGERFKVEQITIGKMKKVALGFFIRTNATIANLKIFIGHQWLRDKKVYLREQSLPFSYGTDLSLIGFYTLEHPWFGDVHYVLQKISEAWIGATTATVSDDDEKRLCQLEQDGIVKRGDGVNIPYTIERSKTTVKSPDSNKAAFSCDVWHVYVPRKHHSNAVFINDVAILDAQNLPQMIPQGLAKTNPSLFYQRMAKHSKFMHDHRNIAINGVTAENYKKLVTFELDGAKTHTSLWALLERQEMIYRQTFTARNASINVSVNAHNYERAIKWIDKLLDKLSFGAWVKHPTNAKTIASRRSDRYSKAFSNVSSDEGSFDPSTIASYKTKNPWKRPPPMELVFDAQSEDQFPPLPAKMTVSLSPTVPTTKSPNIKSPDFEEMLAQAMAAQEQKFQNQLDQITARNSVLDASLKSLTDKLNATLSSIIDKTVEAMTGPASPFFTKADAAQLIEQQTRLQDTTQTQFERILSLLTIHQEQQEIAISQSPPDVATPITCNANRHDQVMTEARHEVGTT